MKYLPTGTEMKEIDSDTITRIGIPSLVLMEKAAEAAVEELIKRIPSAAKILVLAGTGNNGADGVAMVRLLRHKGYDCSLLFLGNRERATAELEIQLKIIEKLNCPIYWGLETLKLFPLESFTVFIDGIFGIGLEREVSSFYREVIDEINNISNKFVLALDIPTGVHSGTGKVMGIALKADCTVTFGFLKAGMALYPGREYCGEVIIKDIGFPEESLKAVSPAMFTYDTEDIKMIPKRPVYSNKGTFGKVLIIGGAKGMSGAAYFSALAAYRMGAGLVQIFTVEENRQVLQAQLPEAIMTTFCATDFDMEILSEAIMWADVIVAGPGLSTAPYAKQIIVGLLKEAYVPMVMDADALNIISAEEELTSYFTENIIITPHPGEMSRLMKQDVRHILEYGPAIVLDYTIKYGVTCVLKGASTLVSDGSGQLYVNMTGNSGLAVGGSGDVLAGMIGGLLAGGMEIFQAATMGVYLHGLAADKACESMTEYGMLPRDLLEELKIIIKNGGQQG